MKKIFLTLTLFFIVGCNDNYKEETLVEEKYYCRNSSGNYLTKAEVTTLKNKLTYVYIEQNHSSVSNMPDNLKDFINETCDVLKYTYNDKQSNYKYKCGDTKNIIEYNYNDNVKNTIKYLESEEFKCYTVSKDNEILEKIKNKTWCNYRRNRFSYTFDEFATSIQNSYISKREYSIIENKIIIHDNSYDIEYIYDEETNTLRKNVLDDYLFECDDVEYSPRAKIIYYYDNKENNSMPKSGFYSTDEYKFNKIVCDNGVIGTYDEDRRMVFTDKDEKTTCTVYFDKVI